MLYSAFLIPIIISVIGILVFSKKIVIGELLANLILNIPFYNNSSIVYNVIGVDDLKHIEFLFKYESFLKIF